jgi:hypothetical protein
MLPVFGDWEEACESVGADPAKTVQEVKVIVAQWLANGEYPEHSRTYQKRKRGEKRQEVTVKVALTQAELLQQLANEMAAMALMKAESSLTAAQAMKLAENSGWFLNIEAEVEKARAYTDHRIGKAVAAMEGRSDASDSSDPADSGVPQFEQDQDVDDDFTGETEAAQKQSEPSESGLAATDDFDDPESSDVV